MQGLLLAAILVGAPLPPEREAEIDALFAEYRKPGVPGCAVGVVQGGELVFARGYGLANLDWGTPIDPRTVFHLGSMSKQFTAAVVHLLALEGVLSLDDDVRRWVPELPDHGHRVTLRQLLHHTGGLRSGVLGLGHRNTGEVTEEQFLAANARQRGFHFAPGTAFQYSDQGYFLLGLAARRATGKPLRQLAAQRLFEPLGMTQTLILDDHAEPVPQRATGYLPAGEGGFRASRPTGDVVGVVGVWSTVEDLARWQRNLEEPRVGGPALAAAMLRPGAGTLLEHGALRSEYASGLLVESLEGEAIVDHNGLGGGFSTAAFWFPRHRLHTIVLCNRADPTFARFLALAAGLLGKPAEQLIWPEPGGGPAGASVAVRAGHYRDPVTGLQAHLDDIDGSVVLGSYGPQAALRHAGGGRYVSKDGVWGVVVLVEGERLRFLPQLGRPMLFEPFEPHRPTAAERRRAVGRYYSEELDVYWEVALAGEQLTLRIQGGEPRRLAPGVRGEWVSRSIAIRLEPGRGPARGFRVYSGTVLGLPFRRVHLDEGTPRASPPPGAR